MAYREERPTIEPTDRDDRERVKHPAFGTISITRPSHGGKGAQLFDSAVGHNDYVSVKISTAYNDRMLNRNFIHEDRVICEFNMSEAQWAHFVASSGMGRGTPITFRYKPVGYKLEDVPGIAPSETMKQTFDREIEDTARRYITEIREMKAKIDGYVSAGKANKTQLSDIAHQLSIFLNNFPLNLAFTQTQFAEAMEKTTEAAKTDIEAFVINLALSTGLDVLRERTITLIDEDNTHLPEIEG